MSSSINLPALGLNQLELPQNGSASLDIWAMELGCTPINRTGWSLTPVQPKRWSAVSCNLNSRRAGGQ
jgi:hypothetical protein